MGAIKTDDVEWAVVDRMAYQLRSIQNTEYAQTLSLALLGGIIDWSCQRLRTPDDFPERPPAKIAELKKEIESRPFEDSFSVDLQSCVQSKMQIPNWAEPFKHKDFSRKLPTGAFNNLVALRNSLSHSDARTVQPYNTGNGEPRLLLGFDFLLTVWRTPWKTGELRSAEWIRLDATQMCAIGDNLADRFCRAMSKYRYFRTQGEKLDPAKLNVLRERAARGQAA